MCEFTGTKWKWHVVEVSGFIRVQDGPSYYDDNDILDFDRVGEEVAKANALLISKAPEFYEDSKKDLELFDKLLKSLPLGLQHLKNAIKDRKIEKEQLIKSATEL